MVETPPPAMPTRVTYDYVTRTIARTLGSPSRGYFLLLGAAVTVCSATVHDRAMARLLAAPLATAVALAVAGAEAAPLVSAAGPGFRDSTRLADTPLDLAMELLFASPDDARAAIEVTNP